MKKGRSKAHFKQKLALYFDENFPEELIDSLKKDGWWTKNYKITTALEEGNLGKDDSSHFAYCKKCNYILVTLDEGFWNDRKFPYSKIPGIIIVTSKKHESRKIKQALETLLSFLVRFPLPRYFIGDSKFKISSQISIMKGRDAHTRQVKTYTITAGDTMWNVGKKFGWF